MKNLPYLLLLLFTCGTLGAQSVTPEVVAPAGTTFTNGTISLEWTLGEIMTETFTGSVVLTQGFHQPFRNVPPPVARCREMVTAQIDADGKLDLEPADLDNGSSDDNTAAAELNFRLDFGDNPLDCEDAVFPPQPAQPVILVVTNAEGLTASCTSLVTVQDTIPPVLLCRDITLAIGEDGARVSPAIFLDSLLVEVSDNCGLRQPFADTTSFSCADLGDNAFTVFVRDQSINLTRCVLTVTVIDPTLACDDAPTAVCQEMVTAQIDADGNLELDPASLDNGSFDDFTAGEDLLFSLDFGDLVLDCDDVGEPAQPVDLIVTDNVGQSDTCTSLITVIDTIPPVLICRDVTVDVSLEVFDLAASGAIDGSGDNCTEFAALSTSFPIGCELLGDNVLNLTIADENGNEIACDFVLTVIDTTFLCENGPPTAACIDSLTVFVDEDGLVDLAPEDLDNGSFDDNTASKDLVFSFTSWSPDLDCDDVGEPAQAVGLLVTDEGGLSDECTSYVTVLDTIEPVVVCRDTIIFLAGPSIQFDFNPAQLLSEFSDNCSVTPPGDDVGIGVIFTCDDLGPNTPLGITLFDPSGNEATCFPVIEVRDTLSPCNAPPTAVCIDSLTVFVDEDGLVDLAPEDLDDGSFDDNTASEDLIFSFTSWSPDLDCDDVGRPAQAVGLLVNDEGGLSDECTTYVTVVDTIPPVLGCLDSLTVSLPADGGGISLDEIVNTVFLVFEDNCGDVSSFPPNSVIFNCADLPFSKLLPLPGFDGSGNRTECTVLLNIVDPLGTCNAPPTAVCRESLIAQIDSEGNLALTPDSLDAGSFDDHTASEDLILSFDTSNDLPGCADVAMPAQSVGLVVTNEAGLTDTCFTLVTVRDTIPPVLICRDVTVDVSLGVFDLAASGAIDGSRDNCTAFAALSSSFPIGCNLVGDNALNLDVQDSYGNVSSCAFTLNVTDTTFLCTDAPLSVAWLSFGADAGAKQVELRWEITEEPDNAGFHVERSATGNDWVSIGTVPAHRKFSQRYAFTDSAPLVGNNYYRLRQTDFSGEVTYSSVEIVAYRDGTSIALYPNPATETINLRLPASAELVGLFNVTGQRSEVRFSGQDGQLQAEISDLPSGLYFARVRLADGHLVTRRLMVNTN